MNRLIRDSLSQVLQRYAGPWRGSDENRAKWGKSGAPRTVDIQRAFGLVLRGGASMRFHPNSRASTDHRPGPNIARAAAVVPARRHTNRSSPDVRIWEISITAMTAPAKGVHSPAASRSPEPASDAAGRAIGNAGSVHSCGPARTRRTEPTTRRMSSKPIPGQLPANVEYRRRNTYLHTIIRRGGAMRTPRRGGGRDSLGSVATHGREVGRLVTRSGLRAR